MDEKKDGGCFVHQKASSTTESIPQRKKTMVVLENVLPAVFGDKIGAQGGGGDAKNKHKIAPFFPPENGATRRARRA
jgi:hypothetical protein